MYKEYLKVKQCDKGLGVFTTVVIPANKPVLEITGPIYLEEDLPDPNHPALLQIGINTFIGASGDIDDLINHSCNPNCGVYVSGNRAILYSMFVIPAGAEITFDYSTTATDTLDKWKMDCVCSSFNCRRVISGHHYLDWETKEKYKRRGFLPMYITNPQMVQKIFK